LYETNFDDHLAQPNFIAIAQAVWAMRHQAHTI
jgi:hypothetical protein